jgi:hypothetical protein
MSFFEEFGDVEVALETLLRLQGEYARGVESTSRAHRDVAMKALYAEIRAYGDRRVKQDHPIIKSNYVDLDRQHEMQRAASQCAQSWQSENWQAPQASQSDISINRDLSYMREQYSRGSPSSEGGGMKKAPYETVILGTK